MSGTVVLPFTWSVFNTSTRLHVVEPDLESTLTEDEARREACAWLIAEADADSSAEAAETLDAAAQDLNLTTTVHVGGTFSWLVEVERVDLVEVL